MAESQVKRQVSPWTVGPRALTVGKSLLVELLFLGASLVAFLLFTLPNLENYPGLTDDEVWILSASHKLAMEHVFGTDLFKGFWRAEEVYLFNMPLHHFVLGGVFKAVGTSIFAARFVSVVYGLGTIVLVYVLARELRGVATAVLAVVLLLFLRLQLAFDTGLPLQEMARSIRYDLAPVPFMLAGALVLMRPSPWRCVVAGVLFSIATLLQFYGAFMFPVAAAFLLLESKPLAQRMKLILAVILTGSIVALPYVAYVVTNYEEFKGQSSTLYRRLNLNDPQLYIENIEREGQRFRLRFGDPWETVSTQTPAKAAILLAFPASLVYFARRVGRTNAQGDRMLLCALALLPLQFLVLDFQKVTFYWIAVVPFLCVGIAVMTSDVFAELRRRLQARQRRWAPMLAAAISAILVFTFVAEGVEAQVRSIGRHQATDYMSLRPLVAHYVPPGSKVLGATNLWWAMPATEFRSYYMLYYRTNPLTTNDVTDVAGYLDEFGAEYVVLNAVARLFLTSANPPLNHYLESRGERVAFLPDMTYGFIEIWRIQR